MYSDAVALSDGGWVVTWSSYNQDGSVWGIYSQRYDAGGIAVGGEVLVNTTTSNQQLYSEITSLDDGGWLVTWSSYDQDGSGWGLYSQRYAADGTVIGLETRVNGQTAGDQFSYGIFGGNNVVQLADGRLVTVYEQDFGSGEIFYVISDLPTGANGLEDEPLAVHLDAALVDTDGSETLTVTLSGFPPGATFNLGAANGSNWVIENAETLDLSTLEMTTPPDWNGTFTLSVTARATEIGNGDFAESSTSAEYTVAPVADDATMSGDTSGSVQEDGTLIATGTLTVLDPDAGEDMVIAQTGSAGLYGTFEVTATGDWTYTLNNAAIAVQDLNTGDTVFDSFTVTSADGTASETVTIAVDGLDDAALEQSPGRILLCGSSMGSADVSAMQARGFTVDLVTASQLEFTDLSAYQGIWLSWSTTFANTTGLLDDQLRHFVQNGGNIMAEVWASNADELLTDDAFVFDTSVHPNGIDVVDGSFKTLTDGLTDASMSGWGSSAHGVFLDIQSYTGVMLASSTSNPNDWATIAQEYGTGNIVLTTMDPSLHQTVGGYDLAENAMLLG